MIRHWSYDDGTPYYMTAISKWSERRRPCWRCHWKDSRRNQHVTEAMRAWFEDTYTEDQYSLTGRFNGGDPFISIEIYDETVAAAFRLTWVDA